MPRQVALIAPCTLAALMQRWGVLPATCDAGAGTAACVLILAAEDHLPRLRPAYHVAWQLCQHQR